MTQKQINTQNVVIYNGQHIDRQPFSFSSINMIQRSGADLSRPIKQMEAAIEERLPHYAKKNIYSPLAYYILYLAMGDGGQNITDEDLAKILQWYAGVGDGEGSFRMGFIYMSKGSNKLAPGLTPLRVPNDQFIPYDDLYNELLKQIFPPSEAPQMLVPINLDEIISVVFYFDAPWQENGSPIISQYMGDGKEIEAFVLETPLQYKIVDYKDTKLMIMRVPTKKKDILMVYIFPVKAVHPWGDPKRIVWAYDKEHVNTYYELLHNPEDFQTIKREAYNDYGWTETNQRILLPRLDITKTSTILSDALGQLFYKQMDEKIGLVTTLKFKQDASGVRGSAAMVLYYKGGGSPSIIANGPLTGIVLKKDYWGNEYPLLEWHADIENGFVTPQ